MLKIGTLQAEKGTKIQGYFPVEGTDIQIPITIICGKNDGKTVLITGGTHGGEYPGIETSIRLATETQPDDLSGNLIILHPVNVPAYFEKLQYFGPHDGKNLNREFPGSATGTVTQRLAYAISSNMFAKADLYLDLHGGDIHEDLAPFVIYSKLGDQKVNQFSLDCAKAMGIKYVCGSVSANGTFGCAATMGVAGFLSEIGGRGLWTQQEVSDYIKGVRSVLCLAGVLKGEVLSSRDVVVLERMVGVEAGKDGCWYPSIVTEQHVKKGETVGEIRDFFGNSLETYTAPQDGVCLYVVSSLAIRKGDPLVALGTMEK